MFFFGAAEDVEVAGYDDGCAEDGVEVYDFLPPEEVEGYDPEER